RVPQIGSDAALRIFMKLDLKRPETITNYYSPNKHGHVIHYHRSPRYWIRSMNFEQYFKSPTRTRSIHHFRDLYFSSEKNGDFIGALLNSSLFFFLFLAIGNGRNITG